MNDDNVTDLDPDAKEERMFYDLVRQGELGVEGVAAIAAVVMLFAGIAVAVL